MEEDVVLCEFVLVVFDCSMGGGVCVESLIPSESSLFPCFIP